MGLLDSPIFTNLIKVAEGTISSDTGNMVNYDNSKGYNTFAVILKVTEGSGNTGDFGITFNGGVANKRKPLLVYDERGYVFENAGYPKYTISKSAFTDFDSIESPFTQTRLFFADITGISNILARVEYCNGTFTFDYEIYVSRGTMSIPEYKPIQKLGSFVLLGDGTTKILGGTDAKTFIPSGFKYVYIDMVHTDSSGNLVKSDFNVTMYFEPSRHYALPLGTKRLTSEKIVASVTNSSTATSDYQEIKGKYVLGYTRFETAPTSGDKIYIDYYGIR